MIKSIKAACAVMIAGAFLFSYPVSADSESGGVFFGGGDSESGGVANEWGAGNQSGGVQWGIGSESGGAAQEWGLRSQSGGPLDAGATSQSGGVYGNGPESDSGGVTLWGRS